jgi:predicted transcriptional regulator
MDDALLKEICGSELRARVLLTLFRQPERDFHLRGLAATAGLDASNVAKLLPRLVQVGIVQRIEAQPSARYRANPASPVTPLLQQLFAALASSAPAVVRDLP